MMKKEPIWVVADYKDKSITLFSSADAAYDYASSRKAEVIGRASVYDSADEVAPFDRPYL